MKNIEIAIANLMSEADRPLTTAEIVAATGGAVSTIRRVLTEFESAGVLRCTRPPPPLWERARDFAAAELAPLPVRQRSERERARNLASAKVAQARKTAQAAPKTIADRARESVPEWCVIFEDVIRSGAAA